MSLIHRVRGRRTEVADLSWLLEAPGGHTVFKLVGAEAGKPKRHGIAKFRSHFGSTRYVLYRNNVAQAGLQVLSRDEVYAVIANVWTQPSARRQGLASKLLQAAKEDFFDVPHGPESSLTESGKKWKRGQAAVIRWTPEEMLREAAWVEGDNTDDEAVDFTWSYAPAFPTSRLAAGENRKPWDHSEALEWLEDEAEIRGADYVSDLTQWWLTDPAREPLVVALDSRGLGHIWDGHHRFAIAVKDGMRTVPVILGTPR